MRKTLFILILFYFNFGLSQQPEIFKIAKFQVAFLSDSLKETSGLHFYNEELFTFNDSGNSSEIFKIDKNSGKITKNIKTNLQNIDWEAMTSDSTNIYIGDFGNNAGTRKDLKIYKIKFKNEINELFNNNIQEYTQEINFYYPSQTDFSSKNLKNDYDAEAMIFLKGKIHLFTKEWVSKSTTHYVVDSNDPNNQPAEKLENYKTGFVVTDATYFEKKLYLIGYTKKTEVFLTIFNENENGLFFQSPPKKYYLGSTLSVSQIEGIAVNQDGIYLSGESFHFPFGTTKQRFYFIPSAAINH